MSRALIIRTTNLSEDVRYGVYEQLTGENTWNDFEMCDVLSALVAVHSDEPAFARVFDCTLVGDSDELEDIAVPPLDLAERMRVLERFWMERPTLQQEIAGPLIADRIAYRDEHKVDDPEKFEIFRLEIGRQFRAMAHHFELLAKAGAERVGMEFVF